MTCPACGATVDAEAFCSWCGLDLHGPAALRLRELIAGLATLDRQMLELTSRQQALTTELTMLRWSVTPEPSPALPLPAAATERRPGGTAEWTVDRVRSVLLWLGAALVAASALTFTAVAWSHLGDGGRATLLGAVTGVFTGIALALRRRLPASAEAFTALAIGLVLIDWHALHRAGVGAHLSGSAWWSIGVLVAAAFALVLGRAVGRRTSGLAVAAMVPLSPDLLVATVAGAAWSRGLGLALISAGVVLVERYAMADAEPTAKRLVELHAMVAWFLAAGFTIAALESPHSFRQSLTPAAVMCTLAFAPALALAMQSRLAREARNILTVIVVAAPLGALVTAAASSFGPEGLLAWATLVGCVAAVVTIYVAPDRWQWPARVAAGAFALPGLLWATGAGLAAAFGPLDWLGHPWTGSLDLAARTFINGPATERPFDVGWPAVWALFASVVALALIAARIRQVWAVVVALALAVLGVGLVPVLAGATARTALIGATATICVLVLVAVAIDHRWPQLSIAVLAPALLAAPAAVGWAALTRDASIAVLCVGTTVVVFGAIVAASEVMRSALASAAGALAVTLTGVWTAAFDVGRAPAGFAAAVAAACVLVLGAHLRVRLSERLGLEMTGAASLAVSLLLIPAGPWLAAGFTVLVPLFVIAALRRDRAVLYGWIAAVAALAATWAWLAVGRVTVVEAYTAPAAALALAAGLAGWRAGPARSWLTLGPALVIALGPTLALGVANDDVARTVAAAVLAFGVVLFGAWQRLQAPLAIGSAALLVLAIDTFGPVAARLPEWVPLAAIGVLLMWIGATFERRREAARRATDQLLEFG